MFRAASEMLNPWRFGAMRAGKSVNFGIKRIWPLASALPLWAVWSLASS